MKVLAHVSVLALTLVLYGAPAGAQETSFPTLDFFTAIDRAREQSPVIRAAASTVGAAQAEVGFARTAYLPTLDILWQTNRATRNNVFGMLLPQSVIPSISGPVLGGTDNTSTWGSVGGALFSWEMFDFGRRGATVRAAHAGARQAQALADLTQVEVVCATADRYLRALAADQVVGALRATVDRMQVFTDAVAVLVDNELRPGVDRSRAEAVLAEARIQLIHAEQEVSASYGLLAEALGDPSQRFRPEPGVFLNKTPDSEAFFGALDAHPKAQAMQSMVDASHARTQALSRSLYPRINAQFAAYSRGTGALLNGDFDHEKGLSTHIHNWAAGVTVTLPLLRSFEIGKRRQIEQRRMAAFEAHYTETVHRLQTAVAIAETRFAAARRIAAETPIQVRAARETEEQTRVRYDSGLATVMEVTEAERLLAQADIDHAAARLDVWRALFALALSRGETAPVLQYLQDLDSERRP